MVFEAVKLAYANKTKESVTSQKSEFEFELLIVFSTNVNLKYLLYLMDLRCSDRAKLFSKIFFKNSNLNESGIFLPVFPSRTNLKLENIR